MMKQASVLLVCAALLLTACSQEKAISNPAATSSPSQTIAATPSPTPTATQAPTPTPTPTPASEKPAEQTIKKEYRMNKNYDIVPIDPNGNKNIVLLTFDDGPKEREMNEALIATLKKHNAKAIFFLNGYRIKQKPELVKFIHDSGQVIGNHAWDHNNLKDMTNEKIDQQVDDVQKIVKELIGQEPQFFRPPFGSGNNYLKDKIKNKHMLYMNWSNGSLDWEMTNSKNDPNKVLENVMKQLHGGSNILMHELPWTVTILDTLLTQLEEKGYSFVDPNAIELEMK
ncbi:polysaccharide deacetylase family protein [Paenibacillus sedimenti]|uniref:Polysaccharide deacetylase family protein n=1 Tax=Paenibacillus sedimenti TaxID=2770274 RepID=A0A926KMW4_9BACL|nr:polysaccharide deacetylase family protein [Paenibacillus sedimenti]MBD0380625.1 polysaccharide deacetylase family protein [Paenibacillus sedimenti]